MLSAFILAATLSVTPAMKPHAHRVISPTAANDKFAAVHAKHMKKLPKKVQK